MDVFQRFKKLANKAKPTLQLRNKSKELESQQRPSRALEHPPVPQAVPTPHAVPSHTLAVTKAPGTHYNTEVGFHSTQNPAGS